jgi:hypothetical protein
MGGVFADFRTDEFFETDLVGGVCMHGDAEFDRGKGFPPEKERGDTHQRGEPEAKY